MPCCGELNSLKPLVFRPGFLCSITSHSIPSHTAEFLGFLFFVHCCREICGEILQNRRDDLIDLIGRLFGRFLVFSTSRLDPALVLCLSVCTLGWRFVSVGDRYGDYEDPAFGSAGGWGKPPAEEAPAVPGAFVEANPETTDL